MLFSSQTFIFGFLRVVLAGLCVLGRFSRAAAAAWLAAASLFFYGWWNPVYVVLLLASIAFNYVVGTALSQAAAAGAAARGRTILAFGVGIDLALLAYYKYANFFADSANALLGTGFALETIVLPLGISFFTFTQIAFLVDAWRGEVREANPIHYALFVTYFPHLIAGPVLHHREMMPQFGEARIYRPNATDFAIGVSIFVVGLAKKVLLADSIAPYVAPVFDAAAAGRALTFFEAWGGALAYTLQLYFDFSGYSDMAIGLSRMFGVKLPLNFDSPYKAVNISEFWRRWHMTLSRFLRDYLYIALGGNRKGPSRRQVNLMATMVLGGLWHGAGWTFVVWGTLHGLYLVVFHLWTDLVRRIAPGRTPSAAGRLAAWALTFFAVVIAWVFFRAHDLASAWAMVRTMLGMEGIVLPAMLAGLAGGAAEPLAAIGVRFGPTGALFQWPQQVGWIAALLVVAWCMPNTQQLFSRFEPALGYPPRGERTPLAQRLLPALAWRPSAACAALVTAAGTVSILALTRVSEFLYFQF